MSDKYKYSDVIRFNMIFNFILLFVMIIIAILAFKTENDNNSIKSGIDPDNLWCYVDVFCDVNGETGDYNANLTVNKNFIPSLPNQQIILYSYRDVNKGLSQQNFDIYMEDNLPINITQPQPGLSYGYVNYSDIGTSIYLQYYFNSVSWNNAHIGNLLHVAHKGTSQWSNNQSSLINTGGTLKYTLINPGSGLCINIDQSGTNSIFGENKIYINKTNTYSGTDNGESVNVINRYIDTLDIIDASKKNEDLKRCIDPSFTISVDCDDVNYNKNSNMYCLSGKTCSTLCDKHDGDMKTYMETNNCGVAFCTTGQPTDNPNSDYNYTTNNFLGGNTPVNNKQILNNTDNYSYKKENIFNGGIYDGVKVKDFNSSPQAQHLLLCGGTSTIKNNVSDALLTTSLGKYPTSQGDSTPIFAKYPNVDASKHKVTLGFN